MSKVAGGAETDGKVLAWSKAGVTEVKGSEGVCKGGLTNGDYELNV